MYGYMFTVHAPFFSINLAQPKILTYQRFEYKSFIYICNRN